jgi:hypothetical protein
MLSAISVALYLERCQREIHADSCLIAVCSALERAKYVVVTTNFPLFLSPGLSASLLLLRADAMLAWPDRAIFSAQNGPCQQLDECVARGIHVLIDIRGSLLAEDA